ncbi:MAG TPA: hypothetical protein VKU94_07145 [Geobacterales bacterium]|nr:hypothetical protein [Geobacterales bacterium]
MALPIRSFYLRSQKFFKYIWDKKLDGVFLGLINEALKYPFIATTKGKDKEKMIRACEEAVNYVKLLFLACQEGRFSERLELLLSSSRKETMLMKSGESQKEEERIKIARYARILAERALQLIK